MIAENIFRESFPLQLYSGIDLPIVNIVSKCPRRASISLHWLSGNSKCRLVPANLHIPHPTNNINEKLRWFGSVSPVRNASRVNLHFGEQYSPILQYLMLPVDCAGGYKTPCQLSESSQHEIIDYRPNPCSATWRDRLQLLSFCDVTQCASTSAARKSGIMSSCHCELYEQSRSMFWDCLGIEPGSLSGRTKNIFPFRKHRNTAKTIDNSLLHPKLV